MTESKQEKNNGCSVLSSFLDGVKDLVDKAKERDVFDQFVSEGSADVFKQVFQHILICEDPKCKELYDIFAGDSPAKTTPS